MKSDKHLFELFTNTLIKNRSKGLKNHQATHKDLCNTIFLQERLSRPHPWALGKL